MKNKRHERRVKRLALIVTLCTIILAVSTYAWFIGMKTVSVSSFDVQIAATEGLSLSLDGITWSETVEINGSNYNVSTYENNTNTWGGDGLIPVSSIGKIDDEISRLVMFEKGSLTATTGGYRLLASRVQNYDLGADNAKVATPKKEEGTGFVAFDLFVKNLSGKAYYKSFDVRNEEAIYLSQESAVSVVNAGSTDPQLKTGIENSVRVAFAQIGRVEADAESSTTTIIQGITCNKDNTIDAVTGSCTKDAVIWEPNDKAHVANAINWYEEACNARSGDDITAAAAYTTDKEDTTDKDESKCKAVVDGAYSQTYAIGSEIIVGTPSAGVDVYDGADYNGYTKTINGVEGALENAPLYPVNYFTDTEKMLTGLQRPQFFSLAPNSITKIRVYVYIEGQDVDNYDFASLGKAITVSFGFTKERFFDSDIDYNGPMSVEKQDGDDKVEIAVPTTKDLAA